MSKKNKKAALKAPKFFERLTRSKKANSVIDSLLPDERWDVICELFSQDTSSPLDESAERLINTFLATPELWADVRRHCDDLAHGLDQYGKITYTRDDRGAILVEFVTTTETADEDSRRAANLTTMLRNALSEDLYGHFFAIAKGKDATDLKADLFARSAIGCIVRRMVVVTDRTGDGQPMRITADEDGSPVLQAGDWKIGDKPSGPRDFILPRSRAAPIDANEMPWERDARELPADIAMDIRLAAESHQLRQMAQGFQLKEARDASDDHSLNVLSRWASLIDQVRRAPRSTDAEKKQMLVRAEEVLTNTERFCAPIRDVIAEQSMLDGVPFSATALRTTYYNLARSEVLGRSASILVEMENAANLTAGVEDPRRIEDLLGPGRTMVGFRRAFAGLCDDAEDKTLMSFALSLWNDTYRQSELTEAQETIRSSIEYLYRPATASKRALATDVAQFAALWAHDAFQKVVTTHTYAAALMCSDANPDALGDLHLPWRAFVVAIPDGLLKFSSSDGSVVDYRRVLVHVEVTGRAALLVYDPDAVGRPSAMLRHVGENLADLLSDEPIDVVTSANEPLGDRAPERRALRMVLRLVTGILVALLFTQDFRRQKSPSHSRSHDRSDAREPEHRITFVGRPLKIDCRAQVRNYIDKPSDRGTSKAPSVQFMVRGHQKRQVIGVGRKGRKVIWIEPYWKGDRDAPILTKPRLIQ